MYYETLVSILVSLSLLFAIVKLQAIASSLYCVIGCALRWKENLNLENSVKLSIDRNYTTAIAIIPTILVAANYRLFAPSFSSRWNDFGALGLTAGTLAIYLLLRFICKSVAKPKQMSFAQLNAASKAWANFFILASAISLVTAGICSFSNVESSLTRTIILYEYGIIYALFIFRKGQILKNSCTLLPTILYLCALEILPAAILVSAAIFL